MHVVSYKFPNFWVNINEDDRYLQTVFEDGTLVPARRPAPEDINSAIKAYSLGYRIPVGSGSVIGDTWAMTKDHELTHSWLAHLDGKPYSLALWAVAHNESTDTDEVREEEARVLEFQRTLNKTLPRPWDIFFDRGLGDLLGHSPAR